MYFNHAFRKSFLPFVDGQGVLTLDTTAGDNTSDLNANVTGTPGLLGAFTPDGTAGLPASAKPFILAQGTYFTNDRIGGNRFLGGYQETVKSKVINPKYISRVMKILAQTPQTQIQKVCVCSLECGKTYRLRLDLKGSPALRFLSHNIYKTLDAFTGCCTDDCSAACTGAIVDPTIAVIKWAKQVVESPVLNQFVKLVVVDFNGDDVAIQGGTTDADIAAFIAALDVYEPSPAFDPTTNATDSACIYIEAAYVDTKFGNCTFTPTDFYELMPLFIYPSLTDESGDACNVQCVTITEDQIPRQATGVGETVIRDMILSDRYLQIAYPDSSRVESLRMREIESNPALATIDRSANGFYDQVQILHSVPRFNNPTGTFDNDQYLLVFHVPAGTDTTALTTYLTTAVAAAGNTIPVNAAGTTFEQY